MTTLIDSPWLHEQHTVRPDVGKAPYQVGSYVLLRLVVGLLSIALPIILILGDLLFLDGMVRARGSLSAYYYSGMRDIFVGILIVDGLFLITYKVFRRSVDNLLSIIAGIAAVLVALFPTGRPSDSTPLLPIHEALSEGSVETVHFLSAAVFIGALAIISALFGKREAQAATQGSRKSFAWLHYGAAAVILLAIVLIVVTRLFSFWESHSILIGEWMAAWAFGASWFTKGREAPKLLVS